MARGVNVRWNHGAILLLTSEVSNKAAYNMAQKTQGRARRFAPVDTGALRESIHVTPRRVGGERTTYAVGSPLHYAVYQEWGTGPIHAKPGGVLRFKPKGSGQFIFRPRTKGVPATHFMAKALAEVRAGDAK